MCTDARSIPLRPIAIALAIVFVLLAATPFVLYGQMPRDPMEPHKITLGAAAFLGLFAIAALGVSVLSLLTAIVAFAKRDRVAVAIALPPACLALLALALLWLDGM